MKSLTSTLQKTKRALKKEQKKPVEKVCSCRVPADEYIELEDEFNNLSDEVDYKKVADCLDEYLNELYVLVG
jgi:5'-deoxynucleotidase YfbR-like HD superfamily hydrolase